MQDGNDKSTAQAEVALEGARAQPIWPEAGSGQSMPEDAPMVDAAQLFGRHRQVVIGHNGCRYVLRITKHGKLILNK
jgi:hemin uptake protein HemP